jgi:hypothetical protein
MDAFFKRARQRGLTGECSEVSLDATGLESHHLSRYFLRCSGRMKRFRRFPKITVVTDNSTHLIAGMVVGTGPCNDSPALPAAMRQASARIKVVRLLADGAYDSEAHHRLCRQELGIAQTIIPINPRAHPRSVPSGTYRLQMKEHFPKEQFGQRWQVESVLSRFKRRLGSALRARTDPSRWGECHLRVLTHNLMIL